MRTAFLVSLLMLACNDDPAPMDCSDMATSVCDSARSCGTHVTEDCEEFVQAVCLQWPEPCQEETYTCDVMESGTWYECLM